MTKIISMHRRLGNIVLINGVSSVGKTTIARELQHQLCEESYVLFSGDDFLEILVRGRNARHLGSGAAIKLTDAFNKSIAALSYEGIHVVVDTVIQDVSALEKTVEALSDSPVYFVGLHCSVEELDKREKLRQDRRSGLAREQLSQVHLEAIYDLELNTAELSADNCVKKIRELLTSTASPKAFVQLKEKFS